MTVTSPSDRNFECDARHAMYMSAYVPTLADMTTRQKGKRLVQLIRRHANSSRFRERQGSGFAAPTCHGGSQWAVRIGAGVERAERHRTGAERGHGTLRLLPGWPDSS